jgi:hypothetical protein
MLEHLNNSGALAPICLFTSKETVFQFWWRARCYSTLNYISIKHTGWRKSYLLNIECQVTFIPPYILNTPHMQTYKISATGSVVIAYQEYDTSAIFAFV